MKLMAGNSNLPLARAIVEAHGGGLAIESAAGRGTVVTVRFPRGTVGVGCNKAL